MITYAHMANTHYTHTEWFIGQNGIYIFFTNGSNLYTGSYIQKYFSFRLNFIGISLCQDIFFSSFCAPSIDHLSVVYLVFRSLRSINEFKINFMWSLCVSIFGVHVHNPKTVDSLWNDTHMLLVVFMRRKKEKLQANEEQ